MPSSTSPISRTRLEPISPSSTTDTLLMPVPPSGGSSGTWPRIGHRTRRLDLVDVQSVTSGEAQTDRRARGTETPRPGGVAGTRPVHPRFEDASDAVALEQERQAGDMVLVRMAQDDRVDAAVPRRDPAIERHEQAVGIGSAVDEQAAAARALDQDRIALPDVEDRDPCERAGCRRDDGTGDQQRADQRHGGDAPCRPTGGWRSTPGCGRRCRPPPGIRTTPAGRGAALTVRRLGPSRPHQAGEHQGRHGGRHDVERRFQRDARERQAGRERDDRDQEAEDHPAGRRDDRADDRRRSREHEGATRQAPGGRPPSRVRRAGRRRG